MVPALRRVAEDVTRRAVAHGRRPSRLVVLKRSFSASQKEDEVFPALISAVKWTGIATAFIAHGYHQYNEGWYYGRMDLKESLPEKGYHDGLFVGKEIGRQHGINVGVHIGEGETKKYLATCAARKIVDGVDQFVRKYNDPSTALSKFGYIKFRGKVIDFKQAFVGVFCISDKVCEQLETLESGIGMFRTERQWNEAISLLFIADALSLDKYKEMLKNSAEPQGFWEKKAREVSEKYNSVELRKARNDLKFGIEIDGQEL